MKKILSLCFNYCGIAAFVLVCWSFFFCNTSKVAVISSPEIFQEATVYKDIQKEQDKYLKMVLEKLAPEEAALQKEVNSLSRKIQNSGKDAKEFASESRKLEQKINLFLQKKQFQLGLIERATLSARQQVLPTVEKVFKELASKKGYQVIFEKSASAFAVDKIDITQLVVKQLNKQSIAVTYPDPATFIAGQGQGNTGK